MKMILTNILLLLIIISVVRAGDNWGAKLRYEGLELLALRPMTVPDKLMAEKLKWLTEQTVSDKNEDVRPNTSKRRRGCKSGARLKYRKRGSRPPLPSVIFGNVRSLRNKSDELSACCKYQYEYRETSLICMTETWLSKQDADGTVDVDGFSLWRADREGTSKHHGGGVCAYVNERWCKNVTIKDSKCNENIELLTIACRPFYLPREFNIVYITVVYIPPSADKTAARETLLDSIHRSENAHPGSVRIILGDFNGCSIDKQVPNYKQYVKCNTRGNKTLDLMYCNVKNGYKINQKPPLGNSDHLMLHCIPIYKQELKSGECKTVTVQKWNDDSFETLKGCFELTDWDSLYDPLVDLNENVDVLSCYINFCIDVTVPKKSVKIFPNNKPWVTKEVKLLLNEKKKVMSDKSELKRVQKDLNVCIKNAKHAYKVKVENMFKTNKTKDAWTGLKNLTGFKTKSCMPEPNNMSEYVNKLNDFYARFDVFDCESECNEELNLLNAKNDSQIEISHDDVLKILRNVKTGKASGPDNVPGKVLKLCRNELVKPIHTLYQASLDQNLVPTLWKTSNIVPVPKKKLPIEMNDLRPVALTSVIMKGLEAFVKSLLSNFISSDFDQFQFAYTKNRSVEDAVITLFHELYSHLDISNTYARILFIDFSSAFNTIQPHIMLQKLGKMNVNSNLIKWVYSYLTARPQYVTFGNTTSNSVLTNTGAPQGCVLSPLLFTLYTSDCLSINADCKMLKYADDTVIIGKIKSNNENLYRDQVKSFVNWCDENYLNLNVRKTKEMIVDFRKNKQNLENLYIKEDVVETVNQYKYLGVTVDGKLNGSVNAHQLYIKGLQRLHFLRILRNLKVNNYVLSLFYKSIIESVLVFCLTCWFGNASKQDVNKVNKIIVNAKRLGVAVTPLEELYTNCLRKSCCKIMNDVDHPLNYNYVYLKSGKRLNIKSQRTSRLKNSFIPRSIVLFNSEI